MSAGIDMRIYDLNKNIMAQMPRLETEEVKEKIKGYLMELNDADILPEFFMLLAAEQRDFTVFHLEDIIIDFNKITKEIFEVLSSRGEIKDVTHNDDDTLDIWVGENLFKMFSYDWGVIKI